MNESVFLVIEQNMVCTETIIDSKCNYAINNELIVNDLQFLRVFVEKTTTVVKKDAQSLRGALEKKLQNLGLKVENCVAYDQETNKVFDWDTSCIRLKLDRVSVKKKSDDIKHQFVTKLSLKTGKLAITIRSCDSCNKRITFKILVCKKCNYSICQSLDCMQVSESLLCKGLKRRNSLSNSISSSLLNFGKNARFLNSSISSNEDLLNVVSEQILPVTEIRPSFTNRLRSSSDSELKNGTNDCDNDLNNNRISTLTESNTNSKPLLRLNSRSNHSPRSDSVVSCEIPYEQILIDCESIIGKGSFGTVRLGDYYGKVAIKFINAITPTPQQVLQFRNEMALLKSSRHSNILLYIGCFTKPSMAIVTEYCAGSTLYRHIHVDETITDNRLILEIATQTANGMGFLHSKDILHRDLKSNNIFLNDVNKQSLVVKIGDFGLATVKKAICKLKPHSPNGSILWMAPEIITQRVEDPYTTKSDVYSYAVVLYELVTGQLPFRNKERNMIFFLVGSGRLKLDISDARKNTPTKTLELIKVCSKYEREERYCFKKIEKILHEVELEEPVKARCIDRRVSL